METKITKDEPAVVFWQHVEGSKKRIQPIGYFSAIKELAYLSTFSELIRQVLEYRQQADMQIRLLETNFFYKPPQYGNILRWHQDVAYFPFEPNNKISLWIPLDPVSEENGTLKYVLGSHKLGARLSVNLHSGASFENDSRPLIPDDPKKEGYDLLTANLTPGDITIHEGRTWHCSTPNRTEDKPRLALSLRFLIGPTKYAPRAGSAASFLEQLDVMPGDCIDSPAFPLIS